MNSRDVSVTLLVILCLAIPVSAQSEYEVNSSAGNVDIDGVQGSALVPTIVTKTAVAYLPAQPASGVLSVSSDQVNALWEIILHTDPLVPNSRSGVAATVAPQRFNLGVLRNPGGTSTFNGGSGFYPRVMPFPSASWPSGQSGMLVVPWALPMLPGGGISMQGLMVHAAVPTGWDLTQATRLEIAVMGSPNAIPGPTDDDAWVMVEVMAPPLNAPEPVTFYDTAYTSIYVTSNGRVTFDGAAPSFVVTAGGFLASPQVGCFMDLDPRQGGNIEITQNSGAVKVSYVGLPHFGSASSSNSFDVEFDSTNNSTSISGLQGIDQLNAPASDVILGISAGPAAFSGGPATNGGSTLFSSGLGFGIPALSTDMIYDIGTGFLPASITATALSSITFFNPGGTGLLNWVTQL